MEDRADLVRDADAEPDSQLRVPSIADIDRTQLRAERLGRLRSVMREVLLIAGRAELLSTHPHDARLLGIA
jgi:hypothetical protein